MEVTEQKSEYFTIQSKIPAICNHVKLKRRFSVVFFASNCSVQTSSHYFLTQKGHREFKLQTAEPLSLAFPDNQSGKHL